MMQLGSATSANAEGLVRVSTNNTTSTRMGIALRATASNTFYHGRISSSANDMRIAKVVSGTNTDLFTTAFTVTAGTAYWIRFRVVGSNLYCRAWADGNSEPGSWTLTGSDSSITGAGGFGLTTNASSTSTTWDFDSYTVTDATTTMVFPMRAKISTQATKVFKTRTVLSTLNTKIFKMRAVLSNNSVTKIFKTRAVLSTLNTKAYKTRAVVFGQNTKSFKLLSRIQTQNIASFKLRLKASITSTKIFKTRTRIQTKNTKAFQMRLVAKAPPLTSGGFTLFANGTGTVKYVKFRATQYPDPALSLSPVLPRLGTSSASWNALTPTNTSLAVKTSLDGVNWSTATSGSAIPGLTGQPSPTIDVFSSNTSASYTSTNKSGGSTATPTFDTTNSRLTLVGGSGALYLNSSITDDDIEVIADMDRSDAGGLVWRMVDSSNYYELGCYDDSASGGFTNALRLYKVASGTRSLLGSASTIAWPRSTTGTSPYKTIRVTMLGAIISVYFDGTLVQTYTDGSPLAAGKAGLRNDGGTSRYYQLRIQPQGDYVTGTPAGDVVTGDFVYTQATLTTSDPSVTPQLSDLTTSARSPQIETGALITQLHDPSDTIAEKYNDELDSIAQTSGDFHWNVANDGSATFSSSHATKAPFCLYSTDLLYKPDAQPAFGADLYRNRQTIRNCLNTVQITDEQKIADGSASSWNMAYALYSAPTITVQNVSKTVGIAGIDSGKDFYWTAGSNTISQDTSATPVTSGYIISVTYVGQFKDIVTRDNLAERAAQKARENNLTTGIVEAVEDGKGMLVSNATTYADGLLARYSNPNPVEMKFTTLRSGLSTGTVLPCFIPEFQLNNRQLLILNISTTAVQEADGTILYEYAVTASDGPNLNNWVKALSGK